MDKSELTLFDNAGADAARMMQKKLDQAEAENRNLVEQLERSRADNRTLQEATLLRVSQLMAENKAADVKVFQVAVENEKLLVRLTSTAERLEETAQGFIQLRGRVSHFLAVFEQVFADPSSAEPGLLRTAMNLLRESVGQPPVTGE